MSVENVKAFFKRLAEDEAFRTEVMQAEKEGLNAFFKAAADAGFAFTEEEFAQVKDESLSDEELEKVAGGLWDINWGGVK